MLAKVFEIDVTQCQHGKGEMSIVAAIIKLILPGKNGHEPIQLS
ncbi:MAG: hypothetical protein WCI18_15980 [Pseudomonadota bacterium]